MGVHHAGVGGEILKGQQAAQKFALHPSVIARQPSHVLQRADEGDGVDADARDERAELVLHQLLKG